jgi:hypothetical protein
MELYLGFFLQQKNYNLYRKMPRALSDVWRHITAANVEGKSVYICKYCSKSYLTNATKMQNHLAKCIKFPQHSQEATSDKSPATSIRGENDESDTLSIATAHGPPRIRSVFDSMEECRQRNADECLAQAVYATGSPLMRTSNVYWKRFLNVLCPTYAPPTRHALSTHLLDAEFNRVQVKVNQIIEKADCIAIISDGWSNVCGQGIIDYIISTSQPVFYKSTDTRANRHTGLYIADELKAVINDPGPQKVFALVTDNAANMKAAWSKVRSPTLA